MVRAGNPVRLRQRAGLKVGSHYVEEAEQERCGKISLVRNLLYGVGLFPWSQDDPAGDRKETQYHSSQLSHSEAAWRPLALCQASV